jgi:hypothetical protein
LKILLFVFALMFWDYPLVLLYRLSQRALGPFRDKRDCSARALPVLVVIPSLIRVRSEVTSIISTVENLAANGYPGELVIVISIDGTTDAPPLVAELRAWAKNQRWDGRTRLFVTGTAARRGKPMAIDHAIEFVKELVAEAALPAFPPVYLSTDADADLGPNSIEAIVYRLQRRHWLTGWPARVVAGALHIRGDNFWQGWRHFFTFEGQLNIQVAREYYVSNIWRYNIRWLPLSGIPGALYCTWSEIFLAIPRFMGYTRTLKSRHWFGWWLGIAPPSFSESLAPALPELVAGDTDDTVTAYVSTIARYENGRFTFELPRTPLHAFVYMLYGILIDRPIRFEPQARVFTSSPATMKGLFKQRRRWNSSRIELAGRFWPVLGYHWTIGLTALVVQLFMARSVLFGVFAYLIVPMAFWKSSLITGFLLGYFCNVIIWTLMTLTVLLINNEFEYWRLALGLPLAPTYQFAFNWIPAAVGAINDVLLFGNVTGFAPETTLIRGGSVRIALLFRIRRAFLLTIRSIVCGDVPLGTFWFGWQKTPWTPSGYEGWTTKNRGSILPPVSKWFRGPADPGSTNAETD